MAHTFIKANIQPNTVYQVRMIVEHRKDDKIYYMLVDQNRHFVFATNILRYFINTFDLTENVLTLEDAMNEFIFERRFNETPFCTVHTNSKRRFSFLDTVDDSMINITF